MAVRLVCGFSNLPGIVQANIALIRDTEDYERVLLPLRETLRQIAEGHGSTNAAFNDRAHHLAIDLAWVLDATIQTHQYLPDPAKYFYDGSNALDQADDTVRWTCSICDWAMYELTRCLFCRARHRPIALAPCAWARLQLSQRTPRACSGPSDKRCVVRI